MTSGLQPERTTLAWQRTTLGLLINGGLLTLQQSKEAPATIPTVALALAAILLAAVVGVVGRQRNRVLARSELPPGLAPRREVTFVGWAVVALCVGGVLVLALST